MSQGQLPDGFYFEEVAPGVTFDLPVAVGFASDERIFVAEKNGKVFIIQDGVALPTPFIDLTDEVLNQHDRGLLSFAFDPEFDENGYVYFLYTVDRDGSGDYKRMDVVGRLTRYTVSTSDPNAVDMSTRKVLIGETYAEGIPNCYYSHAIGTVRFGRDGSLLVSSGDGASYSEVDPGGITDNCFVDGLDPEIEDIGAFRAISPESMAGKVLRLDPETGNGLPTNPFYTGDGQDTQSKIWASGLRNPYRFVVGAPSNELPNGPGVLYIADVGWLTWEEINVSKVGGENFGWPCYEGNHQAPEYQLAQPSSYGCGTLGDHVPPTYWFKHQDQNLSYPQGLRANAIVVGDIYTGTKYPIEYHDRIFYADYARGWIASAGVVQNGTLDGQATFVYGIGPVVDWRYNPNDEYFYLVNVWTGEVLRLRHDSENRPPVVVAHADKVAGLLPLHVQFSSADTFDPDGDPLRIVWQFGDGPQTKYPNPSHTYTEPGVYTATLTATDPSGATTSKSITISAGNTYPTASIRSPSGRTVAAIDERLTLRGTGLDDQDLPKHLYYQWKVISRHNNHYHPDILTATDRFAQLQVEAHGLVEEVAYLEAQFIVTDAGGLVDTAKLYIEIEREGEFDVTSNATPMALVTEPVSGGEIGVIADGITVSPGSAQPSMQFDTRTDSVKAMDWVGYEFPEPYYLNRLELYEGWHSDDGGWFDDIRIEVRAGGDWVEVDYLSIIEPYVGEHRDSPATYSLQFRAMFGDAIRIAGTPGGSASYVSVSELRAFALPGPPQNHLETLAIADVSADAWTTVGLQREYGSMVAACSVVQSEQDVPVVVRMRNASGSAFMIRLAAVDSASAVQPETVHCAITSEGDWRLPDGTRFSARRYNSTTTDHESNWVGRAHDPFDGIDNPIVVGQVMTAHDEQWSSFWSRGPVAGSAPTSEGLYTGKFTVGDTTLADESVGFMVFEAAHGSSGSMEFEAGVTAPLIRGVIEGGSATGFSIPFQATPRVAIVGPAGMASVVPSWPVVYGSDPVAADSMMLALHGGDSDSTGTSAAYVVFANAGAVYQLDNAISAQTSAATTTSTQASTPGPLSFEIESTWPNPFVASVDLSVAVPHETILTADVYDVLGRRIQRIRHGRAERGRHTLNWAGTTASGTPAAPGVYFVVVEADGERLERKVVKLR